MKKSVFAAGFGLCLLYLNPANAVGWGMFLFGAGVAGYKCFRHIRQSNTRTMHYWCGQKEVD